jgi:hypothetical protein
MKRGSGTNFRLKKPAARNIARIGMSDDTDLIFV